MDTLAVIVVAFGLAMDAFAVAAASSASMGGASARQTLRVALHFGLFQAVMPVIGWSAGMTVERWIRPWDHWLAFLLLALVGSRAIYAAWRGPSRGRPRFDPTRGLALIVLSVATSLDALAIGLSFAALKVGIWYPSAIIGVVAAVMTVVGMALGGRLGARFGRRTEAAGGVVLIGIGLKILIEHLF